MGELSELRKEIEHQRGVVNALASQWNSVEFQMANQRLDRLIERHIEMEEQLKSLRV